MTPEEIIAKAAEDLEKANARIAEQDVKIAALDATVNPPQVDPDLAYKPASWKALEDTVDSKAEAAALKVLQDAEKKKEDERVKQEKDVEEQNKKIEEAFKKLEEDKIIEPTKSKDDAGGRQRAQILGSLVRSGGQHVEIEAKKLKTAWDAGMEYDYESNSFQRAGSAPSANRDQFVGSSANRTPQAPQKGTINTAGVNGDLEEARRRWEEANGAA